MTKLLQILVSCQDRQQAERIGDALLKEKLAACVQIVDNVDSMYIWPPGKNQIEYAKETLLLIKTVENKWNKLAAFVKKEHTYENPEIVALPVSRASDTYSDWITSELKD